MKKRLEQDLISIAHRILKLKGKEDLAQLHFQTQKLYEALSVLKFVEDNINLLNPTVDTEKVEALLENVYEKDQIIENEYIQKLETEIDELREDLNEIELKIENNAAPKTVFFNDLIFNDYKEPVFEKIAPNIENTTDKVEEINKDAIANTTNSEQNTNKATQHLNISLNDRVGFIKHLFDDNNEDYVRVLSQISTFNDIDEAKDFIENLVKPDYNHWAGKEDFENRFIEIIAQKFD